MKTQATLDHGVIEQLMTLDDEGGGAFVTELATLFMATCPEKLKELRGAALQGDLKAASESAHSLKSSSANLGAFGLSALCRELEALGKGPAPAPAALTALVDSIDAEYALVKAALEALVIELSKTGTAKAA